MPKSAPLQSNFTGGEISPYAQGRVDQPWYKKSMAICLNAIPSIQGSWTRRGGSKYIADLGSFSQDYRLIPFAPAFGSNCMMVMTNGSLTFYQNYVSVGSITFSNSPVLILYSPGDLAAVRYVQNGSYMYFFHPDYPPWYVGDTAGAGHPNTSGRLSLFDGPYLNGNVDGNGFALTATTLTLSSATPGTGLTLTASAVAGINGGSGFQTTDVGRQVRVNSSAAGTGIWLWATITARTSTTVVTVTLQGPTGGTAAATQYWFLGAFTTAAGHQPGLGTIHEGRLVLSGTKVYPRRFDASSADHDISANPTTIWFSPSEFKDGQVTDANALDFTLFSKDAQNTVWMESDERGLLMGTTGDEWTIRPNTLSGALTPTNVDAKAATFFGSAPKVAPCKVGKGIIFVQRSTLKVREMYFAFDINGYRAPDRTLWAEHITGTAGIIEMAHQREPQSIVWAARSDGTMCALTHEEIDGEITAGWHRHALGISANDTLGAGGEVVSVSTLPSTDNTRDEVWLLTTRSNKPGTVHWYLEVLQQVSNQYIADADQWHLDFATQVTNGSPSKTLSGLSLYNGAKVTVWADGAPYGQFVVSGGTITLPVAVTKALVGFDYNSDGQMLRLEAGSANGTALSKTRRVHRAGLVLQQTLGLQVGMSFDNLTALTFRNQNTLPSEAQPSFSGIRIEEIDADYDRDNMFCWRVNGGAPCTILAVCPRMDTQDDE